MEPALFGLPIEIYSELDGRRMEVRKVEVFRGGALGFASATESGHNTRLGIEAVPELTQITAENEFVPRKGNKSEFEAMWAKATGKHSIA